jgi:hypothetical protein
MHVPITECLVHLHEAEKIESNAVSLRILCAEQWTVSSGQWAVGSESNHATLLESSRFFRFQEIPTQGPDVAKTSVNVQARKAAA